MRDAEVVVVATPIPTIPDLVARALVAAARRRRHRRGQHQGRRWWTRWARGVSAADLRALRPGPSDGRQRAIGPRACLGVGPRRHRVGPHPHRGRADRALVDRLEAWVARLGARPVRMDPAAPRPPGGVREPPAAGGVDGADGARGHGGGRRARHPPAGRGRVPRPHAPRVLQRARCGATSSSRTAGRSPRRSICTWRARWRCATRSAPAGRRRSSATFDLAKQARLRLATKPQVQGRGRRAPGPRADRPGALAQLTAGLGEGGVNIEDLQILHSPEGGRGTVHLTVAAASADDAARVLAAARASTPPGSPEPARQTRCVYGSLPQAHSPVPRTARSPCPATSPSRTAG